MIDPRDTYRREIERLAGQRPYDDIEGDEAEEEREAIDREIDRLHEMIADPPDPPEED